MDRLRAFGKCLLFLLLYYRAPVLRIISAGFNLNDAKGHHRDGRFLPGMGLMGSTKFVGKSYLVLPGIYMAYQS